MFDLPSDRKLPTRQGVTLPLSYPGILKNLEIIHTFSAQTNLTPGYTAQMMKVCKTHGQTKHLLRPGGFLRCGKCASVWVIRHRQKKKQRLVETFGGKCSVCGYKKYIGALDFHHKNPKTKGFSLSVRGLSYSWDTVLNEAAKCILVCENCHSEIEAGITKV